MTDENKGYPTGTRRLQGRSNAGRQPLLSVMASACIVAATLAVQSPLAAAQAKPDGQVVAPLGSGKAAAIFASKDRLKIEAMLTDELQRIVDRQKRLEGQGKVVRVKASLDITSKALVIDLSRAYVPKYNGGRFEDQQHELAMAAMSILSGTIAIDEVRFLFDGKSIHKYFPQDEIAPRQPKATAVEPADLVVVSAAHGYYYLYGANTWKLQRPTAPHGVFEDFITQYLGQHLEGYLGARSAANLGIPRSHATTTHLPSGQPWWKMSARTYLESQFPDNPSIWSTSDNQGDDRQYNQDINARPMFANHINATALLNIHTNADDGSGTARGTIVAYHTGRETSRALGSSVLCYMAEQIHAVPGYASFPVAAAPTGFTNKGENELAHMPAIIVETAFHTNATDAAALQDTNFQKGAMRGVEKGYRMWRQGKPCTTQAIASIPAATGYSNTAFPVTVNFQGYPQLPIKAETKVVSCASGWNCTNMVKSTTVLSETQLQYQILCTNSQQTADASFTVDTTLVDADGVRTAPVRNTYTCKKPTA
ncbi:N-acetylmuramoyl-L-alanine amidase family protein [Lysobacter antibioticus]|uniref:N-acetylmuramoyl-L-alanine amidase family protein n=1 Tax=Lysobacter antibioticus TaxID=84531 RepID=UPI000AFEACE6|nr:N-acetylmuramoyl-L-alanine amidase [Lysobacter antibioticus]